MLVETVARGLHGGKVFEHPSLDMHDLLALKHELDLQPPEVLPPQEMLAQLENINVLGIPPPQPFFLPPSFVCQPTVSFYLAPLVRHSKLPFRHLVSQYDVHITHTPMILAPEFARSFSFFPHFRRTRTELVPHRKRERSRIRLFYFNRRTRNLLPRRATESSHSPWGISCKR